MTPGPSTAKAEPPPGPPWDAPLAEAPLAFVDLEMTGLDPAKDRVLEVCIERVRGDVVEGSLDTLLSAGGAFGNGHIHGIDPEAARLAPAFADVASRVEELLEGAVIVAHAAEWDVGFLEAELARCDRPRSFPHFLDTLALTRRAFALPSHRLTALCASLEIPYPLAHRAAADVAALRAVFARATKALSPTTPRDLWHVRVGQRASRPEILAAAIRASEAASPVHIRYRPARRGVEELLVRVTGVRTDLDPPVVLGYLLPSRSRRELRADRILAIDDGSAPMADAKTPAQIG